MPIFGQPIIDSRSGQTKYFNHLFRALSVLVRGAALSGRSILPATDGEAQLENGARPKAYYESRTQISLLLGGIIGLLLIGLFPQVFLPILNGLLAGFSQLP